MFTKIMSAVAVTGMFALTGSSAMAQTAYPTGPQPLPPATGTYVQPGPSVMLNPQPLPPGVVYRPAVGVGVYLNPQPLPPGIVVRPAIGVYPYPYAYYGPGFYGRYRFRR
jgi:hypothetical protein